MPYRKSNPYSKHTFHHFAWNVYHLLTYQFARYATMAWIVLILANSFGFYKLQNLAHVNRDLIRQNRQRINDIQESRVFSCIQTYTSIQQVFRPFYPPEKIRTRAQSNAVRKFQQIIDSKIRKCKNQTKVKGRK